MNDSDWDIRRTGRAWRQGEAHERFQLTPEKLEMYKGLMPSMMVPARTKAGHVPVAKRVSTPTRPASRSARRRTARVIP